MGTLEGNRDQHSGNRELVTNDPHEILSQWRISSLQQFDAPSYVHLQGRGTWEDKESYEAEITVRNQGIDLPWCFGQEFGEKCFVVTGLRAGGCGVVFLLQSLRSGEKKLYAAKTLKAFMKPEYLNMSGGMQKRVCKEFLEEAHIWLEMGWHQYIVPVHLFQNVVEPNSRRKIPFILSEFMPLGSLRGYLQTNGKLGLKESLSLGIQLCDGLLHAYAHGLNAHLDIKPENIMVSGDEIFKVTDFSANVIGTPGYMAPEQVNALWSKRGRKIYSYDFTPDHAADQFAVGLITLEAILGRQPFVISVEACEDETQARDYIARGVGELDGMGLPSDLERIMARVLMSCPSERYVNLIELKQDLKLIYESRFGTYMIPITVAEDSAQWWFDRGLAFLTISRYASAEKPLREALERYSLIPGTETNQAMCLMNLGNVYWGNSQFTEGEAYFKKALRMFLSLPGEELNQATCSVNLGNTYLASRRSLEAQACYEEALEIFQHFPGTLLSQATCIASLGLAFGNNGRFREAQACFERAFAIFHGIPGTELDQAGCMMNMGIAFESMGKHAAAQALYEKALEMYRRNPGTELDQAKCTTRLANIYWETHRYEDAKSLQIEALGIFELIPGAELAKATCMNDLGNVYLCESDFGKAETCYREAIDIYKNIPGHKIDAARSMGNLSMLLYQTNRFEESRVYANDALKLCEDLHPGSCAQIKACCQFILTQGFNNFLDG